MNKFGRHRSISRRHACIKKGIVHNKAAPKPTQHKERRWYAADDVARPLKSRKANRKPTKLRASITPGTVLILLAGRFKGKRVVFLKQLESGLLLVTGPYKVNGVPLRRVNQVYVIATSTKVDVKKVDSSKINDAFFARSRPQNNNAKFLEEDEQKPALSAERKSAQKSVDKALVKAVSSVPLLKSYLASKFTLTRNMRPHEMQF